MAISRAIGPPPPNRAARTRSPERPAGPMVSENSASPRPSTASAAISQPRAPVALVIARPTGSLTPTSAFPSRLYPKAVRGIRNDKHPPWKPDLRMVRPIHIELLVVAMYVAAAAHAAPRRTVSLNPCADQSLNA